VRSAIDLYVLCAEEAAAARAEFEANPPAAAAEYEAPTLAPPPATPVQPAGLVPPSTLYPPTSTALAGCYLLDVAMGLVAGCDASGDGFAVDSAGGVARFGPRQQVGTLLKSLLNCKDRVETPVEVQGPY
jgi:hypothetical protein